MTEKSKHFKTVFQNFHFLNLPMEITIVSGSPIFTLSATLPSTDSPLYIFIEVDGMAAVATKGLLVPNPL